MKSRKITPTDQAVEGEIKTAKTVDEKV